MSAAPIKWTRESPGLYVSKCGKYEITRKVSRSGLCGWVSYYLGTRHGEQYDTRITRMDGCALLADAKSMCDQHESKVAAYAQPSEAA
tara:strand:+ start:2643 stop:2906 length:264 start_codon:yes stop_codon:yes gene_type:complete